MGRAAPTTSCASFGMCRNGSATAPVGASANTTKARKERRENGAADALPLLAASGVD